MSQRPAPHLMRAPPTVPAGIPIRAGAGAIARANSPLLSDGALMPPPPLPNCPSMSSSVSSRPSFASSDSANSDSFYGRRYSHDERVRTPLSESTGGNIGGDNVDARFNSLLERLQVPSTVRIKFEGVTKDVKLSILDSSMNSNPNIISALGLGPPHKPNAPKDGKKVKNKKSNQNIRNKRSSFSMGETPPNTYNVDGDQFVIVGRPNGHQRGQSMDIPRPPKSPNRPLSVALPPRAHRESLGVPPSPVASNRPSTPTRPGTPETPDVFVRWLESYKGTDHSMDVNRAKKLRMLLRHEVTTWVGGFLDAGGYARILDRIQDLLDIEWREEQHDDKMLFELLRCVKALTTTEVGKAALRAAHPRPFKALSDLLFSEKKPGDLACRQIIIELWLFHFELYPIHPSQPERRQAIRFQEQPPVDVTDFVRALLTPEDKENKTKEYHNFITAAHRPRVFKAWVQELSDICRDYFWIMCHGSNTLWALNEVDEKLVERPVAPGGATGGVEFEAMGYVAAHFRLMNSLANHITEQSTEQARQLHHDLLVSGLDRILITMRKASTTYYPAVHLELARYVDALRRASPGEKLPYLISKMVGPPPEELRRHRSASEWLPSTFSR